jgi:hypothetical protein
MKNWRQILSWKIEKKIEKKFESGVRVRIRYDARLLDELRGAEGTIRGFYGHDTNVGPEWSVDLITGDTYIDPMEYIVPENEMELI